MWVFLKNFPKTRNFAGLSPFMLMTISFGTGPREGETLVCDGHVHDMKTFYGNAKAGKGHDHYLVDGTIASRVDRRRFR